MMIKSITIRNFKSIVDLSFELGSFNVLIGENGCGKSNILEAISMGAAASANKLDSEFLGNRGLRVTNREFMFSAFADMEEKRTIDVVFKLDEKQLENDINAAEEYEYIIAADSNNGKKWHDISGEVKKELKSELSDLLFIDDENMKEEGLQKLFGDESRVTHWKEFAKRINSFVAKQEGKFEAKDFFKFILDRRIPTSNDMISNYVVYSPEQSSLRKFEDANHLYPIGYKGEGLFQYLKELSKDKKNEETLRNIRDNLALLDWYENFKVPDDLMSNEYSLRIQDKYINPALEYFDQRSTNEGFLFLLFYSTLFISTGTPQFFAVENIDASLNPKLCMRLVRSLAELAKKNKKQVIVTTQNPAVLDGLDLKDGSQRLFVVRRNDDGHTKVRRIEYKEERKIKLSEIWTSGFIGGLPDNF